MTNSISPPSPDQPSVSPDSVFDKILAGEITTDYLYEDDYVVAFKDIKPIAPVHVLVIPKHKMISCADFASTEPQIIGEFMQKVAVVAEKIGLNQDGYRIVFNHGTHGGQTVDYIHAHIIGGRYLSWPPG